MSGYDWRICDNCGHRFPFKDPQSVVDDLDEEGNMRRQQWCPVCIRESVMRWGNWWEAL